MAAAGVGVPLGAWLYERRRPAVRYREGRFGRLRPDPRGVLDLLEGFSYRILQRAGTPMSDGVPMPPAPDGMACFTADDGSLVLMRNHELPGGLRARFYDLPIARAAYDPSAAGGVSRVVLDPATREVRSSNMVLAGTVMNCSGGPSPWGWLSCEETVEPDHGYVFLCDPSADRVAQPVRISGYGRFRHEAAAIDPARAVAYLTEDRPDGCLYRFVPHDPADPFEGRLQALRVRARPAENTAAWRRGQSAEIDWIDLPEPTPEGDALRAQAHALGAAVIKRGEGVTFDEDQITLCATTGGPIEAGRDLPSHGRRRRRHAGGPRLLHRPRRAGHAGQRDHRAERERLLRGGRDSRRLRPRPHP